MINNECNNFSIDRHLKGKIDRKTFSSMRYTRRPIEKLLNSRILFEKHKQSRRNFIYDVTLRALFPAINLDVDQASVLRVKCNKYVTRTFFSNVNCNPSAVSLCFNFFGVDKGMIYMQVSCFTVITIEAIAHDNVHVHYHYTP